MTPTIDGADLQARLAVLYEEGRYRESLAEAVRAELPGSVDTSHDAGLAPALHLLGCAHRELHELPAAESRLLAAQRLLAPEGASLPPYRRGLEELGRLYEVMGRYDQTESLYRRAVDLHAGAQADPEGQARCLHALAYLYDLLHRRHESLEMLRQAQEICVGQLGPRHPETAHGLVAQAWVGFRVGKSLASEALARQALAILEPVYGPRHAKYAHLLYRTGRILLPFAKLEEAERLLIRARDIQSAALGEMHPAFAATLDGLALVKLAQNRPKEAETLARRALQITQAAVGEQRLEVAGCLSTLGNALKQGWKLAEAEECQRQANAIARAVLGEEHPVAAEILDNLADTLFQAGQPRQAEETMRQALAALDRAGSDARYEHINAQLQLGRLLLDQGQTDEADRLARQAQQEAILLGPDDLIVAAACLLRARTLAVAGQRAAAGDEIKRAQKIVHPLVPHHPLTLATVYARMEHFLALGDLASAIRLGQDTLQRIGPENGGPMRPQLLRYLGTLRHQAGEFEESERLFEKALTSFRAHYGPEHLEIADTLRGLARLHMSRNNPPAAETRLRQACDIRRTLLGEQHPGYAQALMDLAGLHQQTGNFLAADMYFRQALEILRVNPGEDHVNYAVALHGRAAVLHAVGELAEAEKLLEQALRILRADTSSPDPRALEVRRGLALLHASRADYLLAEDILKQTVQGYERLLGPEHPALIPTLTDLGRIYEAMGDLVACGPVLRRVRTIKLRVHGEGSLAHALDLVVASNLARLQGDAALAETRAQQALAIARGVLPAGDVGLIEFQRSLALACQAQRKYQQAEQLLDAALTVTVAALGPQHTCTALRHSDLGALYALSGRHPEAGRRLEQAADIIWVAQGEDHAEHAAARRILGQHYQAQGQYSQAEKAFEKMTEATRRTAGENHPAVAACLQNLAELHRACKDLTRAAEYYCKALEVLRYSDMPADALHAALLHGRALVLLAQGRVKEAEPLLRAALDIHQTAGNEASIAHLESLGTMGQLCAAAGRDDEAVSLLRKALESGLHLAPSFCCLDQSGSPLPLWSRLWELCEMLLTVALRTPDFVPRARCLFEVVVRLKGLDPKALILAERENLLRHDPALRSKLDTWFVLGKQTANRMVAGAGPEQSKTHGRLLARWQEQRELLERELQEQVPELTQQRRWLNLDAKALAEALPPRTALIEYVRYRPSDFAGSCAGAPAKGPPHYAAFVVQAGPNVQLVSLGEAAPIDRLARAACSFWLRKRARASLSGVVLDPLVPQLERSDAMIIAASGRLGRVRFAELRGRLHLERQVTSGRELLDLPGAIEAEND
jgi:tetratricopeptide (TPR) repeat protein